MDGSRFRQADFDALMIAQNGSCAICGLGQREKYWSVDHDHSNGVVRGILCWWCNIELGHVEKFAGDAEKVNAHVGYTLYA